MQRLKRRKNKKGAVLVEFSMIALIFYFLMAATFSFGRAIFSAQVLQDVARNAAREIATTAAPTPLTLEEVLYSQPGDFADPTLQAAVTNFRANLFDPSLLVIDLSGLAPGDSLEEFIQSLNLPIINQMLRPLMIIDELAGDRVLRYPGAVSIDESGNFQVQIPLITSDEGGETITLVPVLEEIESDIDGNPYLITSPTRGLVALRVNYPYQSAMLTGFRGSDEGIFEPNLSDPILQDVDGTGFLESDVEFGAYAGPLSTGRQLAFVNEVRPFRKFLSGQAIFRREIFG